MTGAALAALLPWAALAQTVPDAGALQQQIEQQRQRALPRSGAPETAQEAPATAPQGASVVVRQFLYRGNTRLSSEQLDAAMQPFLNRPLDFASLQAAAAAAAQAYRNAGWLAQATLPPQEIQNGIVTIQIVEGRLGEIVVGEEEEGLRLKPSIVLGHFDRLKQEGASGQLNADALDRALLLADDLPGVSVGGALRAGQHEGETDLVLKLSKEPLLSGNVMLDNAGARSNGSTRASASLLLNNPFQLGDQANADLIHSQGLDYLRAGYTLPVGSDGWRVGATVSTMNYRLVGDTFAALDAHGSFNAIGLQARYPLVRQRQRNLYLSLNFDHKNYDNRGNTGTTSRYRVQAFGLGLAGNAFDSLGGGGSTTASLALTQGRLRPRHGDPDATVPGSFGVLRYYLSRQQALSGDFSLLGTLSGQWANKTLDSSERFYLGGPYGVRAYPVNEGGGSRGALLNVELQWALPQGLAASVFYDHGRITQTVGDAGPADPNGYSLRGWGMGLAWSGPRGIQLKLLWARRLGANPNPGSTGTDQDGSLTRNRFWLSASLPF